MITHKPRHILINPPRPEAGARRLLKARLHKLVPPKDLDFETKIFLPFSSLVAYLQEGDFIDEGAQHLNIASLAAKKQLGIMHGYGSELLVIPEHDRYAHSLQVALIMRHAMQKAGCSEHDIKLGQAGGLLHDRATPAGGDAIKRLDPAALDEENHWLKEIGTHALSFLTTHRLSLQTLDDIIHNKGSIGALLDAADRISYTLMDLWRPGLEDVAYRNARLGKRTIYDLAEIYDDLIYEPTMTTPIFKDPARLADFLLLRAEMFSSFYSTPANLSRDCLLKEVVQPFYATDGSKTFSPKKLRGLGDQIFFHILGQLYGVSGVVMSSFFTLSYESSSMKVSSMAEAEVQAKRLRAEGNLAGISEVKGFNTALHYLARTRKGDIPIGKLIPKVADVIERKRDSVKGIMVHWAPRPSWFSEIAHTRQMDIASHFFERLDTHEEVDGIMPVQVTA